eukprot:gene18943-25511_t
MDGLTQQEREQHKMQWGLWLAIFVVAKRFNDEYCDLEPLALLPGHVAMAVAGGTVLALSSGRHRDFGSSRIVTD